MSEREKDVIKTIGYHFRLDLDTIMSRNKHNNIVEVRQWCMILFREEFKMGLVEIGEIFNRNHSTSYQAIKKMRQHISLYPDYKAMYNTLLFKIKHLIPKVEDVNDVCPTCGSFRNIEERECLSI